MMPPLVPANRLRLSQTAPGFPNVGSALLGTFRPITMQQKISTVKDGQVTNVLRPIYTSGVIQPMTEDLDLKAEGNRSWEWWSLWSVPSLELATDDVVIIADVQYKVMRRWAWAHYGYKKFARITGFQ